MRKIIYIFIVLFFITKSYGQEDSKRHINFIIMVDGVIPFQGDINLKFIIEDSNLDTIRINYIPGDIVFEEMEFNRIMALMGTKNLNLVIQYSKLCNKKIKSYSYKINFKPDWLKYSFNLLRIYNLDNKENKKIFTPLEGQQYTYEMDSPNGSMIRVKKTSKTENCN